MRKLFDIQLALGAVPIEKVEIPTKTRDELPPILAGLQWIFTTPEVSRVHLARETLHRSDDARSFVRGLMQTAVNLRPDPVAGELRIELHGQANPIHDGVVAKLCEELNATETHYPGTSLRLKYVPLRSPDFLPDQDV